MNDLKRRINFMHPKNEPFIYCRDLSAWCLKTEKKADNECQDFGMKRYEYGEDEGLPAGPRIETLELGIRIGRRDLAKEIRTALEEKKVERRK